MNPVILDVRERDEFDAEHIEKSISVPLSHFDQVAPGVLNNFKEREIILMCRSGKRANLALATALKMGFGDNLGPQMKVYSGGILKWKEEGKTTVARRKGHLPIMRQVQLTAGVTILLSALASLLIKPEFGYVAVFFGAGLAVAGATGFCGMANILSVMPWNKSNPTNKEELCQASPAVGDCER